MSKVEFQIAYDGPGLQAGSMDINDLAPALLAVGDLVRTANQQLNGEKTEIAVRVTSDFRRGSFEIVLILDQSILEQVKSMLLPGVFTSAAGILTILFGTEIKKKGLSGVLTSVADVWKHFKGEKPAKTLQDTERNITIMMAGDGNRVDVTPPVAALYENDTARGQDGRTRAGVLLEDSGMRKSS